jgi:DNA polymerase I
MESVQVLDNVPVTSSTPDLALLVDGHNMIFRAFTSVPRSITDPAGRPVNGVYGLMGTLLRLIRDRKPRFAAVAFDIPEIPTFRHKLFPAYQGQRGPLGGEEAENLAWQVEQAKRVLSHVGLKWLTAPGFEADDILGTLTVMASANGVESLIVTTDRDLQQLVRSAVRVLIPGKVPVEVGAGEVKARLGIAPERIVDWKVLAGDASDNIPGVGGIGNKSAIEMVEAFGPWETVYDNLDRLTPRQRTALERGRADAALFAQVVRLRCDLEMQCVLSDLEVDYGKLPDRAGTALREVGLRPDEPAA